jgi:hypothetical protein
MTAIGVATWRTAASGPILAVNRAALLRRPLDGDLSRVE